MEKDLKSVKEEFDIHNRSITLWKEQIQQFQNKMSKAEARQHEITKMDRTNIDKEVSQNVQHVKNTGKLEE